jgi:hypothetical protein
MLKLLWVVNGIADLLLFITGNRTLNTRCVTKCQHYYNPFMSLLCMTLWVVFFLWAAYLIVDTSHAGQRTKKAPAMTPGQLK